MVVGAFIGAGCLLGAAGLRHDQHVLRLCCCHARVKSVCECFMLIVAWVVGSPRV